MISTHEYFITYAMLLAVTFALVMIAIILIKDAIREYFRNQRLKFTQAEVKERRREIEKLKTEFINKEHHITNLDQDHASLLKSIFYIYNDLIIGIYEGLFDERFVKMTLGREILEFYKKYVSEIALSNNVEWESMAIEMMLSKWDREGYMFDSRQYKHGRMK